jgi:Rab-like protein 3
MLSGVLPLPAQRNLPPPPILDPQPAAFSANNYKYHRYSSPSLTEISTNRTNHEKFNV